jgi:hypothetical protein
LFQLLVKLRDCFFKLRYGPITLGQLSAMLLEQRLGI